MQKAFIRECVARNPSISAKELARKVVIESEKNDGYTLKDGTSCCVIYMRKPRNLLICTGPPFDEKNDAYLSKLVTEFRDGKSSAGERRPTSSPAKRAGRLRSIWR